MHTDEYEISIAREIGHCEKVVGKIEKNLDRRQRRYGFAYPEAAAAATAGKLVIAADQLAGWQDDFEALPIWRQRLEEYRQALAVMRISASRFE